MIKPHMNLRNSRAFSPLAGNYTCSQQEQQSRISSHAQESQQMKDRIPAAWDNVEKH